MRGNERNGLRGLALTALAVAALVLAPGIAGAAWDGTQVVVLGDKAGAEFTPGDGSVHAYEFFAPADTVLRVTAKAAKGANLVMDFALFTDRNEVVPLGTALVAGNKGVKNFRTTAAGWYRLEVTAKSGSGAYLLTTKGKFPKSIQGTVTLGSNLKGTLQFGAFDGTMFGGSAKPASGGAVTTAMVAQLTCPGDDMGITPAPAVANVPLPETSLYTLTVSGDVAGPVDVLVKLKVPKFVKRTWSFGPVEAVEGTPSAIRAAWMGSAHGDAAAEAFHHWDSAGEVEASCARCHSGTGFQDFIGADGSAFGSVDNPVPVGSTIDCNACHNAAAAVLSTVTFPSGLSVSGLGGEARCLQCHQGRESTKSVDAKIATVGVGDDVQSTSLSFMNVHYLAAGATFYGNGAQGAYQYAGRTYNGKFAHVEAYDSCIQCHEPHGLQVRVDDCRTCHQGVTDVASLRNVRMTRSLRDYDGDGNTTEGIAGEVQGLWDAAYARTRSYAKNVLSAPLTYDPDAYPYFYNDANDNDAVDAGEAKYNHFTPRLLRAAYNLQFVKKDPGAFAHNSRYVIEILYDVLADLDTVDPNPAMASYVRGDPGHFDATAEPYRHWDGDGEVSSSCAQCHSPEGFQYYVGYTTASAERDPFYGFELPQGMNCESCHEKGADFGSDPARRKVAAVWWPGATVGTPNTGNSDSFLCLTCHQGRESKKTVDDYIASGKKGFRNVHYLPAGAMLYGTDAKVGYEYDGKVYPGKWAHSGTPGASECTYCHMQDGSHSFQAESGTTCKVCHGATTPLEDFRLKAIGVQDTTDYDGDGNVTEPLKDEVGGVAAHLYAAIQDYAAGVQGSPISYDGASYPYWFKQAGGSFTAWDVRLMKATFNYQFYVKEPGNWVHNRVYVMALMYDSILDLEAGLGTTVHSAGLYVDPTRDSRP